MSPTTPSKVLNLDDQATPILLSRLELLPQELRERIYFYLGFPLAGLCLHKCSEACNCFALAKGVRRLLTLTHAKEELRNILDRELTEILLDVDAVRVKGEGEVVEVEGQEFPKPISTWEEILSDHYSPRLPHTEIMDTNRFFYHDAAAACLHYTKTLLVAYMDTNQSSVAQAWCPVNLNLEHGGTSVIPSQYDTIKSFWAL